MHRIFCFIFFCFLIETKAQPSIGERVDSLFLYNQVGELVHVEMEDSGYYLLFFWHFRCNHCHESLEQIERFFEKEKPNSLKILSIYPFGEQVESFWEYVQDPENLMNTSYFIHLVDPKARMKRYFAPKSVQPPLLVLLDKNKKIVANQFPASELKKIWKKIKP
jgi:hypothetical protein